MLVNGYDLLALPAHDLDTERAVLGAMLIDPRAVEVAADLLTTAAFYHRAHALLFSALLRLSEKGQAIDQVTATEELKRTDDLEAAGGVVYLAQLAAEVATSANVRYHARILLDKAARRTLATMGQFLAERAGDPTVDLSTLTQEADETLLGLSGAQGVGGFVGLDQVTQEAAEQIVAANRTQSALVGLSTGLEGLDHRLAGLQKPDLILLAARPSVGKTSLALQIARHVAQTHADQGAVAVFSLEMSRQALAYRMLSSHLRIEFNRLRTGHLREGEWMDLTRATHAQCQLPIHIDDTGGLTIAQVRARLRHLRRQHPLSLVVVDYLQLMVEEGAQSREQEVARICRGLKALAKELDVPLLALSQLSRASESRTGKRPQLSDLRDSGSLEQDADVVLFLHNHYRAGYPQANPNETEVIIAKQRNGPIGAFPLHWEEKYTLFVDLAPACRQEQEPGYASGYPYAN